MYFHFAAALSVFTVLPIGSWAHAVDTSHSHVHQHSDGDHKYEVIAQHDYAYAPGFNLSVFQKMIEEMHLEPESISGDYVDATNGKIAVKGDSAEAQADSSGPVKTMADQVPFSASGPFNGKDCPVTVVADQAFINLFKGEASTKDVLSEVMVNANQIVQSNIQVGTPVINFLALEDRNPLNRRFNQIDDMVDALRIEVLQGSLRGYKSSCMVHLFTGQNFNNVYGIAYLKNPDGNSGFCDKFGLNVAVTAGMARSGARSIREMSQTTSHELLHAAGSYHDGEGPFSTRSCVNGRSPFLMGPSVSSRQSVISSCTAQQVSVMLRQGFSCLVPRNSVPYGQDPKPAAPTPAPPAQPQAAQAPAPAPAPAPASTDAVLNADSDFIRHNANQPKLPNKPNWLSRNK
jgi:hypothetical protein